MSLERIYTVTEAAELIRVKPDALQRMTKGPSPKIGFLKSGRVLTFPESAIEAYIEAHMVKAAPPNPFGLTDASMRRVRRSA